MSLLTVFIISFFTVPALILGYIIYFILLDWNDSPDSWRK